MVVGTRVAEGVGLDWDGVGVIDGLVELVGLAVVVGALLGEAFLGVGFRVGLGSSSLLGLGAGEDTTLGVGEGTEVLLTPRRVRGGNHRGEVRGKTNKKSKSTRVAFGGMPIDWNHDNNFFIFTKVFFSSLSESLLPNQKH